MTATQPTFSLKQEHQQSLLFFKITQIMARRAGRGEYEGWVGMGGKTQGGGLDV